jgi:hypothetical protein
MNRKNKVLTVGALLAVWLLGPGAGEAHAYIDPGTGSSLLPSIGIIFAVMSAFMAVCFQHTKRFCVWCFYGVCGKLRKTPPVDKASPEAT